MGRPAARKKQEEKSRNSEDMIRSINAGKGKMTGTPGPFESR
jgi:hypothetical protein